MEFKTPRERAEWMARGADSIFEGKVEAIELRWKLVEASVGDIVSADVDSDTNYPFLSVTMEVSRTYRGNAGSHIRIRTGLGGGDCGFHFRIGQQYLIYASEEEDGQLSTGICSQTALLEESGANLSYLRNEPDPVPAAGQNPFHPGSKICGHVSSAFPVEFSESRVLLLTADGSSPSPEDDANPDSDGSFCFGSVSAGIYRLVFTLEMDDAPVSFVYYPRAPSESEAETVEVTSGQDVVGLSLSVPQQLTHSVTGLVKVPDSSRVPSGSKVLLLSVAHPLFLLGYGGDVKAGRFSIPHVLPGEYWAFVVVDGEGASNWWTRKVQLSVEADLQGLTLELLKK